MRIGEQARSAETRQRAKPEEVKPRRLLSALGALAVVAFGGGVANAASSTHPGETVGYALGAPPLPEGVYFVTTSRHRQDYAALTTKSRT